MLFHSHEFLLLLTLTLVAFRFLAGWRHAVLLTASILFYAYAGLGITVLFLSVAFVSHRCFLAICAGRRWALPLGIAVNLLNLFTFKYTFFFLSILSDLGFAVAPQQEWVAVNVILPVGISFYTFQLMAVLIDAHRGVAIDVKNFREFLLFVTFFAQLIAGPIMRGAEFFPQLHTLRGPDHHQLMSGIQLILIGVFKKVVLTDYLLAPRVETLFADATTWNAPSAWLLGLLFGFQIYFDFSGYCDMALGLGKVFGLDLRVNFSTPYVSKTPSEFWSRWNITLSRWFGDYVYIPLGGNRVAVSRSIVNLMLTMLASGLWHGAGFTFVFWGAIHGGYLACFHLLRRLRPRLAESMTSGGLGAAQVFGWATTFAVAVVAWVYFRASSLAEANAVVANMFGAGDGWRVADLEFLYPLAAVLLGFHFLERAWWERFDDVVEKTLSLWKRLPGPVQALAAFPLLVGVVGLTKKLQGSFIYFQF
jgi:alginate O-acetyltransferase complex protein AlgI